MGFTIQEPILVVRLGVSLPNVYVTLRGGYVLYKVQQGMGLPPNTEQFETNQTSYHLSGRMVFFASKDQKNIQPLHEQNINLELDQFPTDCMERLYQKAKSLFPGYTLVDDM